jgi:hypothetical protein
VGVTHHRTLRSPDFPPASVATGAGRHLANRSPAIARSAPVLEAILRRIATLPPNPR